MTPGEDFFLAYSPEREDPGNPTFSTRDHPQGRRRPRRREPRAGRARCTARSSPSVVPRLARREVAEACKILENTYRAVNIALVNELKVLYDRMGIDVWEVIDAAKTKPFGFQAFYPGPGLGGHCIPIDPFYLTWVARQVRADHAVHRAGRRGQHRACRTTSSSKVADALNDARQAGQGQQGLHAGHGVQEGRGRPARVARLRADGPAAARRGRRSATTTRTSPSCRAMRHYPHLRDGQPAADAGVPRRRRTAC